jgi:hypothetical protein
MQQHSPALLPLIAEGLEPGFRVCINDGPQGCKCLGRMGPVAKCCRLKLLGRHIQGCRLAEHCLQSSHCVHHSACWSSCMIFVCPLQASQSTTFTYMLWEASSWAGHLVAELPADQNQCISQQWVLRKYQDWQGSAQLWAQGPGKRFRCYLSASR